MSNSKNGKVNNKVIVEKSLVLSQRCAETLGLKIISVDYVFESGIKILRVIAEGENGLDLDEASKLNELISNKLDVEDFIDEEVVVRARIESML